MSNAGSVCFSSVLSFLALLTMMALPTPARAQCGDPSKLSDYKVRLVKVEGFSGNESESLKKKLDSYKGQPFSADAADRYLFEIGQVIGPLNQTDPAEATYLRLFNDKIIASARKVNPSWCAAPVTESECRIAFPDDQGGAATKCLDVVIKRKEIQVDLITFGSIIVPAYRPNMVALFRAMPGPVMAFNPEFGAERDRKLGFAPSLRISTDLLTLGRAFSSGGTDTPDAGKERRTHLLLDAKGQKSVNEPFYKAYVGLSLSSAAPSKKVENLAIETNFLAKNLPHGDGKLFRNAVQVGASLKLNLDAGPLRHLSIGGNYRWASNRFFSNAGLSPEVTSENAFGLRAIADGRMNNGYLRLAVWADHGSPKRAFGSYSRIAGAAALDKDFVIPRKEECQIKPIQIKVGDEIKQVDTCEFPSKNKQTIGVAAIIGAGRAWKNVPEYARFYGGNSSIDFLHEYSDSVNLAAFPTGPTLRSAGQQQAAVNTTGGVARGGTSFWNLNLNVSIPIPSLSRALIPAVLVEKQRDENGKIESCAKCTSLKQVVKDQVAGGETTYITVLANQKMTPEQLQALAELDIDDPKYVEVKKIFDQAKVDVKPEADKVWKEITPAVTFIADYANIYSIKPLVMFDAARLGAPDSVNNRTRYSLGGGIQFTLVVAKFEAGYLRTLHPIAGDNRGNFIMRLYFQNIF